MFKVKSEIGDFARSGVLSVRGFDILTPTFMPDGTRGAVKSLTPEMVESTGVQVVLANTYHLHMMPGEDVVAALGGLHNFTKQKLPLLTDSGGFQVFSLSHINKITEEGVSFKDPRTGDTIFLSPEKSIQIQMKLGADMIVAFDDVVSLDKVGRKRTLEAYERTHRWLERSITEYKRLTEDMSEDEKPLLFGVVQGGLDKELRKKSLEIVQSSDVGGIAIGGLSVGEPAEDMYEMTELVCGILPADKPRYLMGVGTPENILECIALGIDMFDCVMPTRNARHGHLFTTQGVINIKNERWKTDFSAIDPLITPHYTKAYLRHLIHCGEMLGAHIASKQNLSFYLWLVKEARQHILEGDFTSWKNSILKTITVRL